MEGWYEEISCIGSVGILIGCKKRLGVPYEYQWIEGELHDNKHKLSITLSSPHRKQCRNRRFNDCLLECVLFFQPKVAFSVKKINIFLTWEGDNAVSIRKIDQAFQQLWQVL